LVGVWVSEKTATTLGRLLPDEDFLYITSSVIRGRFPTDLRKSGPSSQSRKDLGLHERKWNYRARGPKRDPKDSKHVFAQRTGTRGGGGKHDADLWGREKEKGHHSSARAQTSNV